MFVVTATTDGLLKDHKMWWSLFRIGILWTFDVHTDSNHIKNVLKTDWLVSQLSVDNKK